MGLNFHDFDWLLEKDKPHGLTPISPEDMGITLRDEEGRNLVHHEAPPPVKYDAMGMALRDTEGHEELLKKHSTLHDFETWVGNSKFSSTELTPITDLQMGVRGG